MPTTADALALAQAAYDRAGKALSASQALSSAKATSGQKPISYTLPPATATVLGGIKVGSGLTVGADGTLAAASTFLTATQLLPVIKVQPAGYYGAGGVAFTLTVVAVGSSLPNAGSYALEYTWYQNGTIIQDGASNTYTNASPLPAASGSYFCRVTNWFGHTDTTAIPVVISGTPLTDLSGNQLTDLNGNPIVSL